MSANPAPQRPVISGNDKIRFAFCYFLIAQLHPHAEQAAEGPRRPPREGKFWQMYELLLRPTSRIDLSSLLGAAERLGLDVPCSRTIWRATSMPARWNATCGKASGTA